MLYEKLNANGTFTREKWNDLTNLQKAGVIAGVGVVSLILYRGVKSFGTGNVQRVPVNPDLLYYQTTTGQTMQWNPDPLAKEFFENFEGYNLYKYPETTDKLNALNDEQVKALYNHYNQYYAEEYPTLTQLIDSEWSDTGGSYQKAVARLKSLGLN